MSGADDSTIPVITIDGPGGSGKGTVSRALAAALGWHHLDSGSLYRLLAYAALQTQCPLTDEQALAALAAHLERQYCLPRPGDSAVMLDGIDVNDALRTEQTGNAASRIAGLPGVRQALLHWQRHCVRAPGLVADGRDMGTVVFPRARLKVFLTASPAVRALRRYNQLKEKGIEANIEVLEQDIAARDRRDAERAVAPLRPAPDALVLDNSDQEPAATVAAVLEALPERM